VFRGTLWRGPEAVEAMDKELERLVAFMEASSDYEIDIKRRCYEDRPDLPFRAEVAMELQTRDPLAAAKILARIGAKLDQSTFDKGIRDLLTGYMKIFFQSDREGNQRELEKYETIEADEKKLKAEKGEVVDIEKMEHNVEMEEKCVEDFQKMSKEMQERCKRMFEEMKKRKIEQLNKEEAELKKKDAYLENDEKKEYSEMKKLEGYVAKCKQEWKKLDKAEMERCKEAYQKTAEVKKKLEAEKKMDSEMKKKESYIAYEEKCLEYFKKMSKEEQARCKRMYEAKKRGEGDYEADAASVPYKPAPQEDKELRQRMESDPAGVDPSNQ